MTDYAYIYTYRPGVMFGKYILTPTTQFPPSQVILSIDPLYKTDKETDNGTDILRYDATASWKAKAISQKLIPKSVTAITVSVWKAA